MENKNGSAVYKVVLTIVLGVFIAVSGYAFSNIDRRISRNERLIDQAIPILSRIDERTSILKEDVSDIKKDIEEIKKIIKEN